MTQDEFNSVFITNRHLTSLMGVSHSFFDTYRGTGGFPEPIRVGRSIFWYKRAIQDNFLLKERCIEL